MPVLGAPGSPSEKEAAASKTAEAETAAVGTTSSRTPSPQEETKVKEKMVTQQPRASNGRFVIREKPENDLANRFTDEQARLGLSKALGILELTAEDLEDINTGRGLSRYERLGETLDGDWGGGRFSEEAAIRVRRQVDYFLSVEDLENDAHARNFFKSNGIGFYVKDFMSWHRMAGLSAAEIVTVCESLSWDSDDRDVCLWLSDDFYWDITDEEKASAHFKEVFVSSCREHYVSTDETDRETGANIVTHECSEAAIRTEL